jgi:ABC-type branched-subunit amino acid transport system substrate-binding protein
MPDLRTLLKGWFAAGFLALAGCASDRPISFPEPEQPAGQPAPEASASAIPAPQAAQPGGPKYGARIGLMLPLSGKNANLGRALHQAAEMGLFETADDTITLMVENTAPPATPEGAARALIARDADILLGPVFGADLKRIASIAKNARKPVLAFTNDVSLAQPDIYVLGVGPHMEVERIVGYAIAQGLRRIALLAPNSAYGTLVLASLNELLAEQGGILAQSALYDPASGDFASAVAVLAQAERIGGFDALLIAEGGQKLRQIAPLLIDSGLDPTRIRMLGTGLWQNDPGLAREPGLAGGWFPVVSPERWHEFAKRYRETFDTDPDPRAALVYDATRLSIQRGMGANGRDYSQQSLSDANGFMGAAGLFRLMPNGTVEHGLAVMELSPSGAIERDPVPASFAPLTN